MIALAPIRPVDGERLAVGARPVQEAGPAFGELLARKLSDQGIRVSAHAQRRLDAVAPQADAAGRLGQAVARAEQKGATQSLILVDDLAFVVSVRNRTVVTAVEGGRTGDGVFTNIDSVVIG